MRMPEAGGRNIHDPISIYASKASQWLQYSIGVASLGHGGGFHCLILVLAQFDVGVGLMGSEFPGMRFCVVIDLFR